MFMLVPEVTSPRPSLRGADAGDERSTLILEGMHAESVGGLERLYKEGRQGR